MIKRTLVALLFAGTIALAPYSATASGFTQARQFAACAEGLATFLFLEPWHSCLSQKYNGTVRIGALNDVWLVVLVIVEDIIKLGGYIAAGFIIWGGIKYVKSQGNASELQQAQMVIKNALLGLVLSMLPVAVIQFIVRELARV